MASGCPGVIGPATEIACHGPAEVTPLPSWSLTAYTIHPSIFSAMSRAALLLGGWLLLAGPRLSTAQHLPHPHCLSHEW